MSKLFKGAFLALVAVLVAGPASAQKLGRSYFEDERWGYRFRYPDEWAISPVQPEEASRGMTVKMEGDTKQVRVGTQVYPFDSSLYVYRFEDRRINPETGPDADGGGLKGRVDSEKEAQDIGRIDIADVIPFIFGGIRDYEKDEPVEDDMEKISKLQVRHRTWEVFTGQIDMVLDTWTFPLHDADVVLLFVTSKQHEDDFMRTFDRAASSFSEIERKEPVESIGPNSSYEEVLAYHEYEASRTPGWRIVETPSKKFIIKTTTDNRNFMEEVIDKLEAARSIFERDYPPSKPIKHVSVVRVCENLDEFNRYSGITGGGGSITLGWFNPGTTELVLFDAVEYDRSDSFVVAIHEGFHQYCHFMFEESEAHRWFDEGHGDYYGSFEFRGSRGTPKLSRMRLSGIREQIREGSYTPLMDHLSDNMVWRRVGVPSYEQSWSIVYMLRQGALGRVNGSVWEDEYAEILPNYVQTLHAGFQKAYAEILEQREAMAKAEGRELIESERRVSRASLSPDRKEKIWEEAMAASWGQIDMEQFEEHWTRYVEKFMRD